MKIAVFLNCLGLGGTEKAACRWARGLAARGHEVSVLALEAGPRSRELETARVPWGKVEANGEVLAAVLRHFSPDVIHCHSPGHPHPGDVLGEAVARLGHIPVVQTNIFGHLDNPKEDAWTSFRLFISWTSCVQAARRHFLALNEQFFRRASVAVYPVDPVEPPEREAVEAFRKHHGVAEHEVLFGRISRPDPVKWSPLAVEGFRRAAAQRSNLKLLLREPPAAVAEQLRASSLRDSIIILPATADPAELALTTAAIDVVLHTSRLGESFGYGLAEPMNFGKPVLTNSVPSLDQAQIELVRHGECGFVASTPATMASAMLRLATDPGLRSRMGTAAKDHIRKLADPDISLTRLENALAAARSGGDNPHWEEDLKRARSAAGYLDVHQFGHSWAEQLQLRADYYRMRLHELRKWNRRRRDGGRAGAGARTSVRGNERALPSTEKP